MKKTLHVIDSNLPGTTSNRYDGHIIWAMGLKTYLRALDIASTTRSSAFLSIAALYNVDTLGL